MDTQTIQVAGIVSYDYLIYDMPRGDDGHGCDDRVASQLVVRPGSADLVAQLLTAAAPQCKLQVLGPVLQPAVSNSLKHNASAVVDLAIRQPRGFSVARFRHIGRPPAWHSPPIGQATAAGASKVIITGSGEAFRDVEPALDFLQRVKPRYIIHYMTRPLAVGRLWDILRHGPLVTEGPPHHDHLAVIIDADDLREEGIPLSQSLSWEATAEDFVRNLGSNGRLDTLVTCPHLIVRFGNQGVIHHRGREAVSPKLYFYPLQMEFASTHMIGLASAFAAGFAVRFPDVDAGIKLGMAASRALAEKGFVSDPDDRSPCYPSQSVMNEALSSKQTAVSTVSIPSTRISSGESFSIFDYLTGDISEVARKIVITGPETALVRCPIRRFGNLLSVDRVEQESLGSIVDTINERLDAGHVSPTCVGIFGPNGAGKKFAAKNLAIHIGSERSVRQVNFNARLMDASQFLGACHTIRDNAAERVVTVACFEDFEAVLDPKHWLLPEFLWLMRDGSFNDAGHRRSTGQCLLIFLISREPPHHDITPSSAGLDFRSRPIVDDTAVLDRLHGVIQLSGPNQIDIQDKAFPVRRAIMLRQLLRERHPHLESQNGIITIDDTVLHALLFVPSYKHGLRSLEKIVSTSRLSGRFKFDIAALPPEEQIHLHVDGKTFMSYLRGPKLPPTLREKLAEGLFETYKKQKELMCKTAEERNALLADRSMADWDDLAGELKESTRAQADDIPRKLRAINLFMLNEERSDPLILVSEFSTEDLDMLSEMEHERFNAERLQRQWRMGARNSKQRTTPFLIPWRDLAPDWREVDRVMVECVPRVLAEAGYRIYRLSDD